MTKLSNLPFNNAIETGVRIIIILYNTYPKILDLDTIVYLDLLNVYYNAPDKNITSIHPYSQDIIGEVLVRRKIIQEGLSLFCSKGLIEQVYREEGIYYRISEYGTPFVDSLNSNYSLKLMSNAVGISKYFSDMSVNELESLLKQI